MKHSERDGLGNLLRALRRRGFRQLPSRGQSRFFVGELECLTGQVKIKLSIHDWDFTQYPNIEVLELPEGSPNLIPHISASGWFCYLAPGSIILDRYDPASAVGQCLEIARSELDRLLANPTYREGEFQTEFGASWSVGQIPPSLPARIGTIADKSSAALAYFIGNDGDKWLLISTDPDEPIRISQSLAVEKPRAGPTCWVLWSECMPTLRPNGLPTTIGEMLSWLKSWDENLYREIQRRFGSGPYMNACHILAVVHSPAGWFGFMFEIDGLLIKAFGRDPKRLRQQFHARRKGTLVTRISISEIGPDFIHSRNLSFPTLKNKAITLVGCGAIGSYLAQALVRLGAGTGTGRLRLIDPDTLLPDNFGRHLLGMESLRKSKAKALAAHIHGQFPHAVIEPAESAVELPNDLTGDLVINATGEEALSEAINFHRLRMEEKKRPIALHVWIVGEGTCAQAIWTDGTKYACFRCLRLNDAGRTSRFGLGIKPDRLKVLGCHAFTPYAVSAPMAAAALAIDLIGAWLSGDVSPRFRTRAIEGAPAHKIKSQNVSPLAGCPACGAT